ncbi:VanR-ABDEGLN family response regulator transcription factor [Anaerorhabdus furcosa]|uniref:Two-component system, OmpR family, response regulator VanR n=1 Tax=Anaerorhabdus furcosa TaxID=118967 RepID=A0A1T4P431_9FIRM|nr:VanR-ABDEGLN family response regulator transcription factor [Anaerorhabdus furcosa]SJZ86273.1 two-component system, OmpR family, response regulator VanR [Anaerorhabdus furcosa]
MEKEIIVVVDDEKEIADLIEVYLSNENYEIHKFYNGSTALEFIQDNQVDLALLDIMLPDMDGFSLCKKIRENYLFPIMMVTAKIEDLDKITGLTLGADDYITKPFNPLELVARVKTQLRRYNRYNQNDKEKDNNEISIRALQICKSNRKCYLNNKELSLTPIEFDILWYLSERQGKVIPTEELFEQVWKEKYFDSNNTVMAHIARLRDKMDETTRKPKYVKTVWGVGYTIE